MKSNKRLSEVPTTGEHEVHDMESCKCLPLESNRESLGWHCSCERAIQLAKTYFYNVDACKHCCPDCNTN